MKKLKIKNDRFDFMVKPLMLLSLFSIIIYVLKLFGIEDADTLYSAAVFITVVFVFMKNTKSIKQARLFITLTILFIIIYICFYDSIVKVLIEFAKNSAIKFSMINTIFNTVGLYDFQNLADTASYGGSFLINSQIVNGAVNIFKMNSASKVISQFLTYRFLFLFSLVGILLSIGRRNINICFIVLAACLTGNYTAILLLLLFVFPVYYLIALISSFACCFISSVIGIKFGFLCSPSVFELFIHNENKIYAVVVCVLVLCVSYYSASLVKEKLT